MSEQQSKPRIAVVFGGRSSEHVISCATAGSVLATIDRSKPWPAVPDWDVGEAVPSDEAVVSWAEGGGTPMQLVGH